MIIGHGMIAKAFSHYKTNKAVLIYASGVSNSGETDNSQFIREQASLINAIHHNNNKLFVYFSTCSIEDEDVRKTPYVLHKKNMEQMISSMHKNYLIFRLPQVVGKSKNRTTLVNYFYANIMKGAGFTVWKNAIRYLIDVEDVFKIANYIIDNRSFQNKILNIAALKYSILDIILHLEKITGKQANYTLVEKGSPFEIDTSEIASIILELNIHFDDSYLENILRKYYSTTSEVQ